MLTRRSAAALLASTLADAQSSNPAAQSGQPVSLVVAGLVHGHAAGMFRRIEGRQDVKLVGIVEARPEVAKRYAAEYKLEPGLFDSDLGRVLQARKPDAVMAFSDTFDHKQIIETCAAHKVPVMVEKPLAISNEHALAIERAARKAGIPVLVNYETSWYPSLHRTRTLLREKKIGAVTKMVVRDGHGGPKEIGVPPEFLEWLTDPARNGAGALFDFGCYGANIATWLLDGAQPLTVTATTQSFKPGVYPKVDDEATVVLTYPRTQVIIQASWNWPFSRKDMDVYASDGYILAPDRQTLLVRTREARDAKIAVPPLDNENRDEVSYLVAVLRGKAEPDGLSSLANNMVVTRILVAARESARTGRTVRLTS